MVRNGLAVAGVVTHASGTAERRASERMLKAKSQEAGRTITVGERPAGTEQLAEEALAALVTRDAMIGVAKVTPPQKGARL